MRQPTQAQLEVLRTVHEAGHCTLKHIADTRECSITNVNQYVSYLERKGCLRRAYATSNALQVTDYGRYHLVLAGMAQHVFEPMAGIVEVQHA